MNERPPDSDVAASLASRRQFLGTVAVGTLAGVAGRVGGTRIGGAAETQSGAIPPGPTIGLETVTDGVTEPTDFGVPPGSDRRFVIERSGQVYAFGPEGRLGEPFLDISDRMTPVEGEQGLLGIAFHPDFQQNGKFYLRYSAPPTEETPETHSHTSVLAEFHTNDDRTAGRPDSERRLLKVSQPQSNHNAGAVAFGPDGYLYVPFGDGGKAHDVGTGHASDWYERNEGGNGQDVTENLLGSILRIDVDNREDGKPYAIPDDNPLVGKPGLDEQFAWGFRNPWRMGFSNGELFVGDVGQNRYEEVDIVRKGGNYGWNVREGTHCFDASSPQSSPDQCPDSTPPGVRGGEPLRAPVIEYPHTEGGESIGKSVICGYIYNGAIDALGGRYVFGDYVGEDSQGVLFAAAPADEGLWPFERVQVEGGELGGSLLAIGRDNDGELYALTTGGERDGAIYRLIPTASASGSSKTRQRTQSGTDSVQSRQTGTDGGASAGMETGEGASASEGPGFGALAALAGLAGVAVRLLGGSKD